MIKFYKNHSKYFVALVAGCLLSILIIAENFNQFIFILGLLVIGLFISGFVLLIYGAFKI